MNGNFIIGMIAAALLAGILAVDLICLVRRARYHRIIKQRLNHPKGE